MQQQEPTTGENHVCTLKEMAALQSAENDITRPHVSVMCTMEYSPTECHQSYKKLHDFVREGSGQCKCELMQLLYPTFVNIYLDLIARGVSAVAVSFYGSFVDKLDGSNPDELRELSGLASTHDLTSSPLAEKFRNHRYHVKMSDTAFHCLMHFLQSCKSSLLLSIIQQHFAIEVCRCTSAASGDHPATATAAVAKADGRRSSVRSKMGSSSSSVSTGRPSDQAETDPKPPSSKRKRQALKSESDSTGVVAQGTDSVSTPLDEFKKRLKDTSDNIPPSAPSVCVFSVNRSGGQCVASSCCHGDMFACGCNNSSIKIWSIANSKRNTPKHNPYKSYSYISLDGDDHSEPANDISSAYHILRGHTGPVYGTCFINDRHLLSSSEDTTVRLWDMQKMDCLACYRGHNYPVWGVAASPIGVYFASCSHDNTARLWSSDSLFPLRVFAGHIAGVDVCCFHPNGNYLATGSCDRTCRLWDIQTGNNVRVFTGSKGAINTLAFSPTGKQLAAAGEDGMVHIWDIASCDTMVTHKGHDDSILAIAYSPCGRLLASCGHDNTIRLWDTVTSQSVAWYDTEHDTAHHLNYTHRNNLVAIATCADNLTL
ncbi:TAF5-like RNA polymerase II p300/CBP-associated factor-associated factor 65 kDa subunit 5L isoform X2 [Dysidea avara]|uniref:TAF5-like RNA polymerase II p300/CBP-associated factor-associated factor 65 kDa subunit 5L isoform X2 n=1 Tax=Dysidea avara TaxID=196820 RepID=UPI00333265AD